MTGGNAEQVQESEGKILQDLALESCVFGRKATTEPGGLRQLKEAPNQKKLKQKGTL